MHNGQEVWAEIHAQQARIIEAFRALLPQFQHHQILDLAEGLSAPPTDGARRVLVEGGLARDELDSFGDDDDEDFGDDD